MKRAEYLKFLRWFRTEICEETPLSHEYFIDKYIANECGGENDILPLVINWVALQDEQPPKNDVYYCYGHGKKPHICNYKDGTWWRQPWSKQIVGITHWRRLPEPPCL